MFRTPAPPLNPSTPAPPKKYILPKKHISYIILKLGKDLRKIFPPLVSHKEILNLVLTLTSLNKHAISACPE